MKTIIIDDELPAINLLSGFANKISFLQVELKTTNALEALQIINSNSVDLLFLDIEMPDISGIDFMNSLTKKPLVVFTTAYEEYALKGYDLEIVDYLLKPIRFERFLKAANRAHHQFQIQDQKESHDFLLVKSEYKTVRIAYHDILFIEGLKDYVKIYTAQGMVLTRSNVKGMESKLPSQQFIRIHRSYIVSLAKIELFQKRKVTIGSHIIPVGDTYLNSFEKYF